MLLATMLQSPHQKLTGLLASGAVTAGSLFVNNVVHPVVGALPIWAVAAMEWMPFVGAPIGLWGIFHYGRLMYYSAKAMELDVARKQREEREAHRLELQEIQSAASKAATTVAATAVETARVLVAHDAETAAKVVEAASHIAECVRRQSSGQCMFKEAVKEAAEKPKTHSQKLKHKP